LIEFAKISMAKNLQMHQNRSDECQSETSDVKEMPIGIYLKGIRKATPADYRLEISQLKQSPVCLKTPILPPK
jgi:hypothetical protein